MKKIIWLYLFILPLIAQCEELISFSSPGHFCRLQVKNEPGGKLTYSIWLNGKIVLQPSALGMILAKPAQTLSGFDVLKIDSTAFDETWEPVWGEQSRIRNRYKQLSLLLKENTGSGIELKIIFRLFDDGLGFRYEFPAQANLNHFIVADELTTFSLTGDHQAFWIPGDYDTNEYEYTTCRLSEIDAGAKQIFKRADRMVRIQTDPCFICKACK